MSPNGGHQLLPTTDSPTISACTTSTNLSNLEFQSSSTLNQQIYYGNNLRRAVPEIEPLQPHKNNLDMTINATQQDFEYSNESLSRSKNDKSSITTRALFRQVVAAVAVSWVSMVIGYVSGYTSPAGISLKADLQITDLQFSWISGLMPLAALLGGLLGGPLIEGLGRKWTLLLTNVLFLVSWIINYFAQEYWYLYISRSISGCGVGIASLTLPVYLGETLQPEVRGTLGLLPTAFGNIGILLCFSMGIVSEWKGIAGIGALLAVPFLFVIWFIPETPRWYISKNKTDQSRRALEWLRDKNNQDTLEKEFEELLKSQKIADEKADKLKDLYSRPYVKSLLIVLGLMFFQQFSGINAVIFYTTQIFEDTGSDIDSSVQTIIVGAVNFASTFIATILIDRLGRKVLLYISSVAMIITLAALGAYFYLMTVPDIDIAPYSWMPLASFVVYVLGFSFGFGPIPWLMMGEILPAKIRGPAASIATGFNWTCTFVVTTTFPIFKDIIGAHGTFWLFCAVCVLGLVFTIFWVPETKGQSLEDIERKLAGEKVRRMSSVANMKPLQSTF
ncbi:facilitated trehalose transporter Tret1 isoform X2 [Tribolium castaneum]|uniref:facilitated trehalose transporter Tret1 isoform X2 n=1 Tax=Tribolium castaneum TaxID=7070 RepID=UPI00077DE02B|nr:PREDICTED: facilitated trehalose transporter Tret1 isoform X2 [Tribolium castaneum]|eukprot:XP_015836499.1 PREDICTED: facilitated trehalose transporter Tret1 isoform X2 [Tribolium castaneum]